MYSYSTIIWLKCQMPFHKYLPLTTSVSFKLWCNIVFH